MPTLDWIGKVAVVNHHRQVSYRHFKTNAALSAGQRPPRVIFGEACSSSPQRLAREGIVFKQLTHETKAT